MEPNFGSERRHKIEGWEIDEVEASCRERLTRLVTEESEWESCVHLIRILHRIKTHHVGQPSYPELHSFEDVRLWLAAHA